MCVSYFKSKDRLSCLWEENNTFIVYKDIVLY